MSFIPDFSANYLDGKECFYAWIKYGSITKASPHVKQNPVSGMPPTPRAFWVATYRWVLDNHEEARKEYVKYGQMIDDSVWENFLYDKAKEIFLRISSFNRFETWVNKYGGNMVSLMENDSDDLREMAQNKVIERRNQRKRKEKKLKTAKTRVLEIRKLSDSVIESSKKLQGLT